MGITQTKMLSAEQKKEILSLMENLKNSQGLTLSFPFEDASSFYLLYQDSNKKKELVSVLALILPDPKEPDGPVECAAFTAVPHQRRGYFSALFEVAADEFNDCDLLIYTDQTNEGALKALKSLEAEWDFDEYRMEFWLQDTPVSESSKKISLLFKTETSGETGDLIFTLFEDSCGRTSDTPIGTACLSLSKGHACLYGFEIIPGYRRRGYGKEALLLFLAYLKKEGVETVFLHVSGENEAALRLYEKTGFRITETLSCYLY